MEAACPQRSGVFITTRILVDLILINLKEWRERLKNRPILTGGILLPTSYSPAFPRMKPQPMAISRIITNRLKQKERRFMKMEELNEMKDLIRREQQLELKLREYEGPAFEPIFEGEPSWSESCLFSLILT